MNLTLETTKITRQVKNSNRFLLSSEDLRMDLYPKDFTERLEKEANEIKEFIECLKNKGAWNNGMKVYKDKDGNLVAE